MTRVTAHPDIYFSYRPAGGSWETNVKVNDDLETASQSGPAIAVDSSGNACAVWMDDRNGDSDIYFSYRLAGGVTPTPTATATPTATPTTTPTPSVYEVYVPLILKNF